MNNKPKAIIMSGYGINCEEETKFALDLAGAESKIVHINDLIDKKDNLNNYQILVFPGGFSYGDDTFSGNAYSNRLKNNLWDDLNQFIKEKKIVIGICNGFQIMTNLGLFSLDGVNYGKTINALLTNDSNRYECRWVHIKNTSKNPLTKDIKTMHVPVAHGEGRFYCDDKTYKELKENDQILFRYSDNNSNNANQEFPLNPNGSIHDIAGISDKTGRIIGMMPHPERAIQTANNPNFHRLKEKARRNNKELQQYDQTNLQFFKNIVRGITCVE